MPMRFKLPLTRRSFLEWSALFTGASFILPTHLAEASPHSQPSIWMESEDMAAGELVFVAESGEYKKDARFVLGMLSVQNPTVHEAAFLGFRNTLNYRSKLTWRSTDRYKKGLTDLMMNYFVNQADFKFEAKVYNWNGAGAPLSFAKRSKEKIPFYNEIISDLGVTPTQIRVKSQSPYGPGIFFKQDFQTQTNYTINAVNTQSSNLLQFAGIITGCVHAGLNADTQNTTKKAIVNVLYQSLHINSFSIGTHVPGKFKIR